MKTREELAEEYAENQYPFNEYVNADETVRMRKNAKLDYLAGFDQGDRHGFQRALELAVEIAKKTPCSLIQEPCPSCQIFNEIKKLGES